MSVPGCDRCGAFPRRSVDHDWEYQNSAALGRLRASNFLATDQEVFYIQNILPTLDKDISHMESKIVSLRMAIDSMKAERDALKNVRHNYEVLISPYRRIPPEVWSRIFLFTREDEVDFNSYSPSGVIWRISHVCEMWRNVALSLQAFWARLRLEFPADSQPENDNVLEQVLMRSHRWPLDISITSNPLHPRWDPPNCNPAIRDRMLGMLFAESCRWKTVSLTEMRLNSDALYALLQGPLPILESLSLYFGQDQDGEPPYEELDAEPAPVVLAFKDCPHLTRVMLHGVRRVVELPWGQINELRMDDYEEVWFDDDYVAFMDVLRCTPSLEVLQMVTCWVEDEDDESTPIPMVTNENICTLDTISTGVMDNLTLPRLQKAILFSPGHWSPVHALSAFDQLVERSHCADTLTSLKIANVPLTAYFPDDSSFLPLHSILSRTSSLTRLELRVSMKEFQSSEPDTGAMTQLSKVVQSLDITPNTCTTFLPRLSFLTIEVVDHMKSSNMPYFGPSGSFAPMVKARWAGDEVLGMAKLKTFHFSVNGEYLQWELYRSLDAFGVKLLRGFTLQETHDLDELAEDGMDLVIRLASNLTAHDLSRGVVFEVPCDARRAARTESVDSATVL